MSDTQSFFLVIEGLDGSGKSEISRRLAQTLRETHDNVKLTFEPHDPSAAGLYIRQVLTKKIKISERGLALAFALNRTDHVEREVEPFLNGNGNRILICDRYYLSSLVYQSVPNVLSIKDVWELNKHVRRPDLTIFLYAEPSVCYERIRGRAVDRELFEHNLNDKIEKYSEAITFLRKRGDRIVEVDADGDVIDVLKKVIEEILKIGPDWLHIQRPLLLADTNWIKGAYTEAQIQGRIDHIIEHWKSISAKNGANGKNGIRERIGDYLDHMSADQLNTLFLDYVRIQGYSLGERLPWVEVLAYELKYMLPIGIDQSGIALILPESQRYDTITRKMQEAEALQKASAFIIVLDPNSKSSEPPKQYEREITTRLSPAVDIIGRKALADYIYAVLPRNHSDSPAIFETSEPIWQEE